MFDRQTVCIPAGFSRYVEPPHGFVAGINILETAREDVVDAGFAVGGGRPIVESKKGFACAMLQAFLKHRLVPPEFKNALLQGRAVIACIDFSETHTDSRVLVPSPGLSAPGRFEPPRGEGLARGTTRLCLGCCPALVHVSCPGPVSKVSRLSLLPHAVGQL